MTKLLKWTIVFFVLGIFFDFATTEILGAIGSKLTSDDVTVITVFFETNFLYYRLGKGIFWTIYFLFHAAIIGLLAYTERKTMESPRRRYLIALGVAYVFVWGVVVFRLVSGANNIWQLLH